MNFKLPPSVDPPPLQSVESALSYRVTGYLNDAPFEDYERMAAHIERQRPLIEARRRAAQTQAQAGDAPA